MAEAVLFPTLSEDAWVDNPQKTADLLMAHFFVSNASQSYIYNREVASFPYILAINHGNMSAIISATTSTLTSYFARFFENVIVEVREVENVEEPSKAQLEMVVQFVDHEGRPHSVGEIIKITDSTFEKVIRISNG